MSSPDESLRPKKKLVPAGASSRKAPSAKGASPKGASKTKKKSNVYKNFGNAVERELTAADKKIVNMLNAYVETLGNAAARAKVIEKLGTAHAERSGKDKSKAFKAALEKLVGRKLTALDLELVTEDLNDEDAIRALASKIKYRPFKKALGHSPTENEIGHIVTYQGSEARKAASGNAAKAMNKEFIAKLKEKAKPATEERVVTEKMKKARTARLKTTKEESDAFDDRIADEKVQAMKDLKEGRTKKTEPAAKDVNALAKIRAHGIELDVEDYLLIQYDQESETATEIIVGLQEQAEAIGVCAQCEVEELLRHI